MVNGLEQRNRSTESRKLLQRLAKVHVLSGVWVYVCGRAMEWVWQALVRSSQSGDFASCGP